MTIGRGALCIALVALPTWMGCAVRSQDEVSQSVDQAVQQRVGETAPWHLTPSISAEAAEATRELLQAPLTVDAAVRIALLNNRNLQASYEELGIARADLQQAARGANPELEGSVRFPADTTIPGDPLSPRTSTIDLDVSFDLLTLGLIGSRKKVAVAQLARSEMLAIESVLDLVARVKSAYYELQAATQTVALQRAVLDAADASLEVAKRLRDAGNARELDLANEQVLYGEARLAVTEAEARVVQFREELTALMGLSSDDASSFSVSEALPALPPSEPRLEGVEARALAQNPGLAAADRDVERLSHSLGLADSFWRWFPELRVGGHAERETEGDWTFGPSVVLALPLLDQGQAQVARAEAELRQAELRRAALDIELRAAVRASHKRLEAARTRVETLSQFVLPGHERIVQQTQLEYNAMQVGVFDLIEAKKAELHADREFIDALKEYWLAHVALERALGGKH